MSKQSVTKAIHHVSSVVYLVNELIRLKIMRVVHRGRFEIMSDFLPSDSKSREARLLNLWVYARIGLDLSPDHILEIFDAETGMLMATVSGAKVTIENSFIL